MFYNIDFIKTASDFVESYSQDAPAPMFRRKFRLGEFENASLYVCALGYGYFYINGEKVSEDLFCAPVSDYNKTLWYMRYDVTSLLQAGENCLAAICGNGFFNESFTTSWDHNLASWRDNPKFVLKLVVDGQVFLTSDTSWRYSENSPVTYNHLRSGEYFDSRLYDPDWNKLEFDDTDWKAAVIDQRPPKGVFRECLCEPIREQCEHGSVKVLEIHEKGAYVFDIGQNISGYIRLNIHKSSGTVVKIRYAEEINEDGSLNLNNMTVHYKQSPFQTDIFICNGNPFTWSPKFCYHGFRYIELTGIDNIENINVCGVFVHQDICTLSNFECSNKQLQRLFEIGQLSVLSNLFYMPTDCPQREKLGWANDAQASAEQMLLNFNTSKLFIKWLQDIYDAIREDGALPGIIPSSGWGYEWGNGPVSDGALFEIPHMLYLYTGNKQPLLESRVHFKKYIDFIKQCEDDEGFFEYGLDDWAPPEESKVPLKFICAVFFIKMLRIAELAEVLAGNAGAYTKDIFKREENFKNKYMKDDKCVVNEQTAVALILTHGLYENLNSLKLQLAKLVENRNFRHNCGMVGLRHLYNALNICGLQDYAYRIITADGYPSYFNWLQQGATTLWELWQGNTSHNHHMYSDFMAWIIKTLLGINLDFRQPDSARVAIKPHFQKDLDYCMGYRDTEYGRISVSWKRQDMGGIMLEIDMPNGVYGEYDGVHLKSGKNFFDMA